MKVSFEREVSHHYLIPETEERAEINEYQIHMLSENRIRGFLECTVRKINCRERYCYDITGRQSLAQYCETGNLGREEIGRLLGGLYQTLQEAEKYLLDSNHVILEPECIYLNQEMTEILFCYLPVYKGDLAESFRSLASYLLYHIDQVDQQAVLMGYRVYRLAMEKEDSMLGLLRAAAEEAAGAEKKSEKRMEAAKLPVQTDLYPESGQIRQTGPAAETETTISKQISKQSSKPIKKPEKKQDPEKKRQLYYGLGILAAGLGTGAAALFKLVTVTQAGGIAFLLTGVIGYLRSFRKHQQEKKNEDPGREIRKQEETAEKRRRRQEKREKPEQESHQVQSQVLEQPEDATVVLREGEEYTPRLTLFGMNSRERKSVVLVSDSYLVGKQKNKTDICIDDPAVSRIHARIQKEGEDYVLYDLNSTNGTFVNGKRLEGNQGVRLQAADEITFGETGYYVGKC